MIIAEEKKQVHQPDKEVKRGFEVKPNPPKGPSGNPPPIPPPPPKKEK